MSASIAVLADPTWSAATLYGSFDRSNEWFLAKHLEELDGDVVIDCRHVRRFGTAALAELRRFRERAERQHRRVVFRARPAHWAWLHDD